MRWARGGGGGGGGKKGRLEGKQHLLLLCSPTKVVWGRTEYRGNSKKSANDPKHEGILILILMKLINLFPLHYQFISSSWISCPVWDSVLDNSYFSVSGRLSKTGSDYAKRSLCLLNLLLAIHQQQGYKVGIYEKHPHASGENRVILAGEINIYIHNI